jgi:hypothetical protein
MGSYSENKKGVLQNLFVGSAVGYCREPSEMVLAKNGFSRCFKKLFLICVKRGSVDIS